MQKLSRSIASQQTGKPIAGLTVVVKNYPAGTLATIYATNIVGTPIANSSLTTDVYGSFEFYAADGRYSVTISGSGYTTRTISDILIQDTQDESSSTFASITVSTAAGLPTPATVGGKQVANSPDLAAPAGSNLVGYLQGGTGSIARTVQSKSRDTVSVFDFLTSAQIADVVAMTYLQDVGSAIVAAIAATPNNGTLLFPYGGYAFATGIVINKNIHLLGLGQMPILKHTGTGVAVSFDGGATVGSLFGVTFSNFGIQGSANTTIDLFVRATHHSIFDNIRLLGATICGLEIDFCVLNIWKNLVCSGNETLSPVPTNGILITRRGVGENSTTQTFINTIIEGINGTGADGIKIDYASDNTFVGGTSEGGKTGVELTAQTSRNTFIGVDFEANTTRDILIGGADNVFQSGVASSSGGVSLSNNAFNNLFIGGYYSTFTADSGAGQNTIFGASYVNAITDTSNRIDKVRAYNLTNGYYDDDIVTGYLKSTKSSGGAIELITTGANAANRNWGIRNAHLAYGDMVIMQSTAKDGDPITAGAVKGYFFPAGQYQSTFVNKRQVVTYSASMTPDASTGNAFDITVTDANAMTINNPTNPTDGQRITITIINTSGGAMGVITWGGAFKLSAWTNPATGNNRSIDFEYNGSTWKQIAQTGVDIPN